MTKKMKGRTGWHQATPKTTHKHDSNRLASLSKAAVMWLSNRWLLPMNVTDRIINRGGLRDA